MNRKYYESVDLLKVLLLVLLIINSFTLIYMTGIPVLSMLNFSVGTFYVLFGYFVLRPGEEISDRIKRAIQHTAIAFCIAAVVYFALVCLFMLIDGNRISDLFTKKNIFDFIVLNGWAPDLGGNIWIIHAALYALIIFYFLNKWGLLKYDLQIMIALFVITILLGEFAGFFGFSILGYKYIPGCFLTRAMPYMLLGRILYKARFKRDFGKIKNWMWVVIFLVGLALVFIEMIGLINSRKLVYLNHMIGFIPMSAALAVLFLNMKRKLKYGKYYADIGYAGFYIYSVIAQVLYALLLRVASDTDGPLFALLGVFTAIVTLVLSIIYARIKNGKLQKAEPESEEKTDEAPV